jgi:hypothetical protein
MRVTLLPLVITVTLTFSSGCMVKCATCSKLMCEGCTESEDSTELYWCKACTDLKPMPPVPAFIKESIQLLYGHRPTYTGALTKEDDAKHARTDEQIDAGTCSVSLGIC